jgi:hypothetical protein
MANFDDGAKEHVGSVTSKDCIVPENVIGTDKNNTETSSRWAINVHYANRMVDICFV